MHHAWHLIFAILTLGLWGVSWLAIYIGQRLRPWRCEHCNWNRPDFRGQGERRAEVSAPGPLRETE